MMSCSKRTALLKRRGHGDRYSEKEVIRHLPDLMPLLQWWRRQLSNLPFWKKGSKRGWKNCCSNYRVNRDWRIWRRRTSEVYLLLLCRENIKPEKQADEFKKVCQESVTKQREELEFGNVKRGRNDETADKSPCSKKDQNIGQSCVTFFGREFAKHRPQTMDI